MTMKKKVTVTTLAASMMFASIAGLPLSEKGLASKLGFTVSVASAASAFDQLNALKAELARDTAGAENVAAVRSYVKDQLTATTNEKYDLIKVIWDKIEAKRNNSAPGLSSPSVLNIDNAFKLVTALDVFYSGSKEEIEELMNDADNRAIINDLFLSANLKGIDEVGGLTKKDVIAFQDAALQALVTNKGQLIGTLASALTGNEVDSQVIKNAVSNIVNTAIVEPNSLLISQLMNYYGITLSDMDVVQNKVTNFIELIDATIKAKDARVALESASIRYLLKSDIQYAPVSTTQTEVVPGLKVLTIPVNDYITWSVQSGSNVKFSGNKLVLDGANSGSGIIQAKDSKFGMLLYISPNATSLSKETTSGGGGGGGLPEPATPTSNDLTGLKDQLKDASDARKQEIFKEAQSKVENAIKEIATLDLNSLITIQGDTAKPTLNVADLVSKLKDIATQAKTLNDQLKALNPNAKEAKIPLTLQFGTVNAKETEIPLAKELLAAAIANGVDSIAIAMNGLSLAVSPSEFGADTTLKVTNQDTAVATSVTQLPVASGVYEFEFTSGGSKVGSFNKPVEVTIPVPNGKQFDTELLSLAKIVDGKLEFYGGSYANGALKGVRNSFSTYTVVENKVSFEDTASVKGWAGRQIQVAAAKGILEGRAENAFDPNGFVTRAEFAKMIVKTFALENANATENFDDVNDTDWFKLYVASAVKNGIVNGKEAGKFDPNGQITRAEMAVMSSRALSLKGVSITPAKVEEALKGFADSSFINSSLKEGVALAASEGIVIGEEGNTFNPNANSTRAQAAVVIYRLLNK
ncbi:S-layer homology domain-containing protein [Paenibacillus planticolens]|uniref:SLH domain-containing protein n=1 Tax=Paenibacillus planticolens TaxID=2654976 RepID=A0ABX1ZIU2_9BACL|nr:S-layer homology domain-containing protein [Paenibacillus planticolens]NOV00002.1 hypothetical protein [Paenibacillus planticolens]